MARTTPLRLCRGGVAHFDDAVLRSFGRISGLVLSDQQRAQAALPLRHGGCGLRSAESVADAAYIGSRAQTHQLCLDNWPLFHWDVAHPGSPVVGLPPWSMLGSLTAPCEAATLALWKQADVWSSYGSLGPPCALLHGWW